MPHISLTDYTKDAQFLQVEEYYVAYWSSLALESIDSGKIAKRPVVLFLHGFPSASYDWHHQWAALNATHHCVALDFLGFGLSDKPHPQRYSLQQQTDIVVAVMQHLQGYGIAQCAVVAHDYGVSVGQELLARGTELPLHIHSMTFLNGGLFAHLHRPLLTQKLLHSKLGWLVAKCMSKRTLAASFAKIFGPNTPPSAQLIDDLWQLLNTHDGRRVIPSLLRYLDERHQYAQRWRDALVMTHSQLAFINGVRDPISGQHMLDEFSRVVPHAKTFALDVGHYPQLEAPEAVTKALLECWT